MMSRHILYDRVRFLTDRLKAEGAPANSTGYIIEVYPGDRFEVEISDPWSGETLALVVAGPDDIEVVNLASHPKFLDRDEGEQPDSAK